MLDCIVAPRVHRARSACPKRFHDSVTIAAVAIAMNVAKRIERDIIRLIAQVRIQLIRRTPLEFS
jgi:hypothetical protein